MMISVTDELKTTMNSKNMFLVMQSLTMSIMISKKMFCDDDDDLPLKFKRRYVSDTSKNIRKFCLMEDDTDDDDDEWIKFKKTHAVDTSNDILNLGLIDKDTDDDVHDYSE
nr:hypothetical protein [Tanacetum cinerariifolium]